MFCPFLLHFTLGTKSGVRKFVFCCPASGLSRFILCLDPCVEIDLVDDGEESLEGAGDDNPGVDAGDMFSGDMDGEFETELLQVLLFS